MSAPSMPADKLPIPNIYYDSDNMTYWKPNAHGGWIRVDVSAVKRHLSAKYRLPSQELKAVIDQALLDIQEQHDVSYAGPLAGYNAGFYEIGEHRLLVTSSPKIIQPMKGVWPTILKLLEGMFPPSESRQLEYLFGWAKLAYAALRQKVFRPGQALVIAGPRNSGKSFIQNHILTPLLGGRVAKPFQFMIGRTPFNSDLFAGEHLMIEDEPASTHFQARHSFGAALKEITVNQFQRLHQKHRPAIAGVCPRWRISITVNDEPESLMVLPPIDESIEDKIILLKSKWCPMPMPTETPEQREAFTGSIQRELPAFLHHLENWDIPAELRGQRFGIKHYHHPDILDAIDSLSPETRLLSLIDSLLFSNSVLKELAEKHMPIGAVELSAAALERRLCDDNETRWEAKRLLYFTSACGVYLGKLAKKHPGRISSRRINGQTLWKIAPPQHGPTKPIGGGVEGNRTCRGGIKRCFILPKALHSST